MSGPFGSSAFSYITPAGDNGLGDRLTQNGINYALDLNAGLTQVLSDGTNQDLYCFLIFLRASLLSNPSSSCIFSSSGASPVMTVCCHFSASTVMV